MSETELRVLIQDVLRIRAAMDLAVANPDPVVRSRQLAALVRSGNGFARLSAIQKLEGGGAPETNVLFGLLSDRSLLGWHPDMIGALVRKHAADVRFAGFLAEETAYWSRSCRIFKPGWWNTVPDPDAEGARNHYTRAYALLEAIRDLNLSEAAPAVRDFAAVWSKCPPLEKHEKTNQITEVLKSLRANRISSPSASGSPDR